MDRRAGLPTRDLIAIADEVFAQAGLAPATLALWRPRFVKAARWFVDLERKRRKDITQVYAEIRGTRNFASPGGDFLLRGRADRIDILRRGGAAIIDYKTGNPPTPRQVEELIAPQLPLEGAILSYGGFPDIGRLAAKNLIYIQFGGGAQAGRIVEMPDRDDLVARSGGKTRAAASPRSITKTTAYFPRVMPYPQRHRRRLRPSGARARMVGLAAGRRTRNERRRHKPPIRNAPPGCRPMRAPARPTRSPTA